MDYLPTRLIDVRQDQPLRLVSSRDLDQARGKVRYATLSYCWGTLDEHSLLKTKRTNLDSYQVEIPTQSLPITFRDAIRTVRSLDIPYLWIDSLCIVQDDIEEWQREATQMKNVYSCGTINIAASDGVDASHGCYPNSDGSLQSVSETSRGAGGEGSVIVAGTRTPTKIQQYAFSRCCIHTNQP